MPDRKPERRPILDPSVADLLSNMEQRQSDAALPRHERERKARERSRIEARRDQRATYDLPPALRQRIKELAEDLRLPASQLVTLALARFLQDYEKEMIDLSQYKQPSRSPRYDWNLIFPEILLPAASHRKRKV
jgi:hypothetical protein